MEEEMEIMLGIQAGITIVLAAMVATHPEYESLQLKLPALLEFAAEKTLFPTLSERQKRVAQEYVAFLQQIKAAQPGSDPSGFLSQFRQ